jgi:hypothetical protein
VHLGKGHIGQDVLGGLEEEVANPRESRGKLLGDFLETAVGPRATRPRKN